MTDYQAQYIALYDPEARQQRHTPAQQIAVCVAEFQARHGKAVQTVYVSPSWAGVRVEGVEVEVDPLVQAGTVRIEV
jgi:hypothetical protein